MSFSLGVTEHFLGLRYDFQGSCAVVQEATPGDGAHARGVGTQGFKLYLYLPVFCFTQQSPI